MFAGSRHTCSILQLHCALAAYTALLGTCYVCVLCAAILASGTLCNAYHMAISDVVWVCAVVANSLPHGNVYSVVVVVVVVGGCAVAHSAYPNCSWQSPVVTSGRIKCAVGPGSCSVVVLFNHSRHVPQPNSTSDGTYPGVYSCNQTCRLTPRAAYCFGGVLPVMLQGGSGMQPCCMWFSWWCNRMVVVVSA